MSDEARLAEKIAFFNDLSSLTKDDDETDHGLQASMTVLKQAMNSSAARQANVSYRDFAAPATSSLKILGTSTTPTPVEPLRAVTIRNLLRNRSVHEPAVATPVVPADNIDVIEDTPIHSPQLPQPQIPRLKHSVSTPIVTTTPAPKPPPSLPTATSMSAALGKRKRGDNAKLVPEERRIFSDLQFFFVPNDEIAAARRLRIRKALQYGAIRATIFDASVTHIIVDKEVTYKDVLKYLKLTELPDNVVLVTEGYPADCISYRELISADQVQYRVRGFELRVAPPVLARLPSTSSSEPTQRSLQIKPVKMNEDVVMKDARTPSRTDDSSIETFRKNPAEMSGQSQAVASMSPEKQRRMSNLDEEGPGSDPLQALIEQAKAGVDSDSDDDNDKIIRNSATEDPDMDENESDNNDEPLLSKQSRSLSRFPSTDSNDKIDAKNKGHIFACMRGGNIDTSASENPTNPNARTCEVLQQMATYYDSICDQWRTRAYRQAISTLRTLSYKVTSKEQAAALPNISERIAAKIEEIVWTNRLRRLESTKEEDQTLQLFANIYGVGLSQASKWIQQGLRTLQDLLDRNVPLTENQRIGIAHFDDFQARIPREEVAQLGEIVRRALLAVDPGFQATIGGSYRRGAKDSGDIDIVITKPDATAAYLRTIVIETLVPELFKQKFLTAGLAVTSKDSGSKWHGACQLPSPGSHTNNNPWRRIDLLLVPWTEIGAAMIYFTGNDIFNRSMRLLARKKGMRLNQRGLYKDVIRGKGGVKLTEGVKIEGEDERRIFERLGVGWREAVDRNC